MVVPTSKHPYENEPKPRIFLLVDTSCLLENLHANRIIPLVFDTVTIDVFFFGAIVLPSFTEADGVYIGILESNGKRYDLSRKIFYW